MTDRTHQQSRLKALIAKGKEQGYLTYAEVNDHLPQDISDPDQVEDIIQMINDMGIQVFEQAPDADELILTEGDRSADEIAAAEAAAALAAVENEAGRTTDPVRMYMREMGTVELLTREGEIVIAKRIEEGIRELMAAMAHYPGVARKLSNAYDMVAKEERKLSDILVGYLDPAEHVPSAQEMAEAAEAAAATATDDDDTEVETGPDPVEAKKRFTALKRQCTKTEKAIVTHGYSHKTATAEMDKLGELFKFFKLTPRVFDPLVDEPRDRFISSASKSAPLCVLPFANAAWIVKSSLRASPALKVTAAGCLGSLERKILAPALPYTKTTFNACNDALVKSSKPQVCALQKLKKSIAA